MDKVNIVFWSQSGNTEAMANAIADGVKLSGKDATVINVSNTTVEQLKNEKAFALGCPAMGAEVLEEGEMEPFVTELEKNITGKTILLFGSYGWGDGQWMRDWTDRMTAAGATVLNGKGIICQDAPNEDITNECVLAGKQLSDL